MENEDEPCDGVGRTCEVAEATVFQWRRFVRQSSSMMLPIYERASSVVLPIYERAPSVDRINLKSIRTEHEEEDRDYREHFPTFVIGISIIQVIFYAVFNNRWLTLIIGYDPQRRHEIWRYLTANLVHSSVSHLCGNLVMQLILGVLLEIVHRWKPIAIIYFASCVGGTLLSNVYDKSHYTVGASSRAMGLLFSHLATILLNWSSMDYKMSRFFCVLLYIVWEVCQSVYSESLVGQSSNISHAGHIGGAVTGFLVSFLVLKTYKKRKHHSWLKTKRCICIGILSIIFVIIFLINITSSHYPQSEWNFTYKETFQKYAAIHYNITDKINFPVFRNYTS